MAQDIRKMFEQERKRTPPDLAEGHEARFLGKLEKELPQKKKERLLPVWFRATAAALLCISIVWGAYYWNYSEDTIIDGPVVLDDALEREGARETKNESTINISTDKLNEKPRLTLSDISPDLKKVETFFIASIKVELANLKVTGEEQEMVDAYLTKVKELGREYDKLNEELNTIGVNDMTITALIENLKIRLQLLQRLKRNLNHTKKEHHAKESSGSI